MIKSKLSSVGIGLVATLIVGSCRADTISLPPFATICGGTAAHFAYAGRNDVPTIAWFAAPPKAPRVGNNLLVRITPQTQAFLVPIGTPTDADILVVPFSFKATETQKEFGVQVERIFPQAWALDHQLPVGHFYARSLLSSPRSKEFNSPSDITASPTRNSSWEHLLEFLRMETSNIEAERKGWKASKTISFLKPIDGQMPLMGSILIYNKEKRKVLCFVAEDWPEALVEGQIGACLAALYGYVGPELDYNTEVEWENIIKYQKLEDCSRAIQTESEKLN
jgi:hypothetical protein